MKYDSALGQQSISGKIVSLILCVWKPCYMKSGHIWRESLNSQLLMHYSFAFRDSVAMKVSALIDNVVGYTIQVTE